MRRIFALAFILGALACNGDRRVDPARTQPAEPGRSGTAVIGVMADIENWNPYLTETAFADDILRLIYPRLAVEQTDYKEHPPTFAPALAESWEFSDDDLTLTMHLRSDAVWSDKVPVTAEDVVFTWRTHLAPEVAWLGVFSKDFIEVVEAEDAHTVRFRFTHRYPYQLMDAVEGLIIPAHAWGKIPYATWHDQDWKAEALSAGRFRLVNHTPQQEIVLEANPNYWEPGLPMLERVVWRIIPSQVNLLTQFKAGTLDFVNAVPPREAKRVQSNPRTHLLVFPDRAYVYIAWNNARPPLNDPRVRRALTMAIDREMLLQSVRHGFGSLATGPILSLMWAFNDDIKPLPHDPNAAQALLVEAGWEDHDGDGIIDKDGAPLELELMTNSENQERRDICVLVHDQLARVGITVHTRFVEFVTLVAQRNQGEFDGVVGSWREPTMIDLEDVWHTPPPDEPTSNWVGYSNPEVDRLIAQANELADFGRQKPLFDRIQELIVADQPYTFIYESHRTSGLSARVRGADINDATPYFNLEQWYIAEP